jgi:hypothetical protein
MIPHFVEVLIVVAISDLGRHHIADPAFGTAAHADAADRDIAVGDHADQAVIVGHRQQSDAERRHRLRGILQRVIGSAELNLRRHRIGNFHVGLRLAVA